LFPNWKKNLPRRNKISKLKLRRRASFTGTKFGGGGKRGQAKIPSPPTPFLFARPSVSVLRAKRAIIRSFAQKMFELRPKNTARK